jgi:serine/threonine protein phosphatase 1
MRHLAVGDIHGCFKALTTLAEFVQFRPEDVIITLGNYVNRGPDTRSVLEWLINYKRSAKLVPLLGNHEIMMLRARESDDAFQRWNEYGGNATLSSYTKEKAHAGLADVPELHWTFLETETRTWFETETHFFVHANAYPEMPLEDQPDFMLFWESFNNPRPHQSGKVMVCGHTSQKTGVPLNIGHAVCIDTRAYGGGWLTCLDVASGRYWQANQRGETRSAFLEEADEIGGFDTSRK